jgi:hypothetical protein
MIGVGATPNFPSRSWNSLAFCCGTGETSKNGQPTLAVYNRRDERRPGIGFAESAGIYAFHLSCETPGTNFGVGIDSGENNEIDASDELKSMATESIETGWLPKV